MDKHLFNDALSTYVGYSWPNYNVKIDLLKLTYKKRRESGRGQFKSTIPLFLEEVRKTTEIFSQDTRCSSFTQFSR
jgi:hypothetical protein